MIGLFTDFGASDLYVPQIKLALVNGGVDPSRVLDLLHEAPAFDIEASAHLLAAYATRLQGVDVILAVVDPGVGTDRRAVVLQADDRWLVGPDNGLFSVLAARSRVVRYSRIAWRPATLSDTFHGRDLFAPIAAKLAVGHDMTGVLQENSKLSVAFAAQDSWRVIYVYHYGNGLTGVRACMLSDSSRLQFGDRILAKQRVFGDVPVGVAFWYENSLGLVEIACNQASAAAVLGLEVGAAIRLLDT